MSINTIKSTITDAGGLARPNKFAIELPNIPGSTLNSRELNVLCRTATMPSKQVSTLERRIGMETSKVGYGYIVDDVNMSFLMVNDYKVKRYFDTWRSLIIDENAQTVGYKEDYQHPIVIHQLASAVPSIGAKLNVNVGPFSRTFRKDFAPFPQIQIVRPTYSIELINAFPITTSALEFNNEQDGILELQVQIAYTNWQEVKSSQRKISIDIPGNIDFEL